MKPMYKFIGVLLLSFYCFNYLLGAGTEWHFIDNVNLIIHEAGHWIFAPFSEFITAAGGSLLQLIVPLMFVAYFLRSGQKVSAAVMLMWLSINFFSVAAYAGDALVMKMELLGGEGTIHDWNYLLATTGRLRQAEAIERFINILGLITIAAGLYVAWVGKDEVNPHSKIPLDRF